MILPPLVCRQTAQCPNHLKAPNEPRQIMGSRETSGGDRKVGLSTEYKQCPGHNLVTRLQIVSVQADMVKGPDMIIPPVLSINHKTLMAD